MCGWSGRADALESEQLIKLYKLRYPAVVTLVSSASARIERLECEVRVFHPRLPRVHYAVRLNDLFYRYNGRTNHSVCYTRYGDKAFAVGGTRASPDKGLFSGMKELSHSATISTFVFSTIHS